MIVVAVTGGMGSGKSSVTRLLGERGAHVISSDALVHEVLATDHVLYDQVAHALGPHVVDERGYMIREAVAAEIFSNDEKKKAWESILHPRILERIVHDVHEIEKTEPDAIVAIEIPLLAEVGWTGFSAVVVVTADEEVAVARKMEERNMTADQVRTRRAQQASNEDRMNTGDTVFVIDNSSTPEALAENVARVWGEITALEHMATVSFSPPQR